jgi:MoaA/NifB/PqqE/SkfB family radical SAM enzyme
MIIDRLETFGTQNITLSGGEPTLHPQFEYLLEYATGKQFLRLNVLTNLYGTEVHINSVIDKILKYRTAVSCSFDGFDSVADTLRGVPDVSAKVSANMRKLTDAMNERNIKIPLYANVVISAMNLHQIEDIVHFLGKMNWKVNVDLYRWESETHRENDRMKITDTALLAGIFERIKKSKHLVTPHWMLDGYIRYLNKDFKKTCPYLESPAFGSKFFIRPNGEISICRGYPVGNILDEEPQNLFRKERWEKIKSDLKQCEGCWNSCFTMSANVTHYLNREGLRSALSLLRYQFKKQ